MSVPSTGIGAPGSATSCSAPMCAATCSGSPRTSPMPSRRSPIPLSCGPPRWRRSRPARPGRWRRRGRILPSVTSTRPSEILGHPAAATLLGSRRCRASWCDPAGRARGATRGRRQRSSVMRIVRAQVGPEIGAYPQPVDRDQVVARAHSGAATCRPSPRSSSPTRLDPQRPVDAHLADRAVPSAAVPAAA